MDEHRGDALGDAAIGPDDVAVLIYTSGTTGPSEGALAEPDEYRAGPAVERQHGRTARHRAGRS
jgi:acyl-coenzyme A synthetase/AMP-(fatty) acid ligase